MKPSKNQVKKSICSDTWLVNLQVGKKLLGITVAETEEKAIQEWKKAKNKYTQEGTNEKNNNS